MPVANRMSAPTGMTTEPGIAGLYRLLAWLSPVFPTGGFSYSHGLEAAAADGAVHDRATLEAWIAAVVAKGSGRIDADLLRDAYRAAASGDAAAMAEVDRRGLAYRATAELALESAAQGKAFLLAHEAAWMAPHPNPLPTGGARERDGTVETPRPIYGEGEGHVVERREGEEGCHAVVFGAAAARAGIGLADALLGYLQAFAANLLSAGLRLGIIGQTDGQRVLAALEPVIDAAALASLARDPEDFGAATFALDLASIAHETQYTRLFRS
jgi:urease accessory protein